jgi:tripartite-type tricarboxylate transporter receptor subunit TctC
MRKHLAAVVIGAAVTIAATAVIGPARADEAAVAAFYKGKQIRMVIGLGAGEAYDIYARLLARHYPKHIPGSPVFVPQNQPGAGSLNAINSLYNTAARDGTVIGTGHRFVPMMPLLDMEGTKFDPLKFTYIGSMNREIGICIAMKEAGFRTVDDMKAREFVVGTTGAGAELTNFNATLRAMLGLKLKVIVGYRTSLDINAAMERGELQGRCGVSYGSLKTTRPQWVANKDVDILIQFGLTKEKELPDVPLLGDLVSDASDRQALELMLAPSEMGRPFLAPPEIPVDRAAALRAGFDASMKDPALIEEAGRLKLELAALSGAEMAALVSRLYKAPPVVVERARTLVRSAE